MNVHAFHAHLSRPHYFCFGGISSHALYVTQCVVCVHYPPTLILDDKKAEPTPTGSAIGRTYLLDAVGIAVLGETRLNRKSIALDGALDGIDDDHARRAYRHDLTPFANDLHHDILTEPALND